MITSTTYITLNSKTHTCMYLFPFFIIKEFIEVQTANCSLWSNGAMYFELKFISNDTGKWLYSFNHLLHSDLSTIYFPSSLNKLKLFLSPFSDCSNTNHATRKKKKKLRNRIEVRQDLYLSVRTVSKLSPFGNLSHRVYCLADIFFRRRRPMSITGVVVGKHRFHDIKTVLC